MSTEALRFFNLDEADPSNMIDDLLKVIMAAAVADMFLKNFGGHIPIDEKQAYFDGIINALNEVPIATDHLQSLLAKRYDSIRHA